MGRRLAAVFSLVLIVAARSPAAAVTQEWSLVGGPTTSEVFSSTTYTFTATSLTMPSPIGCVEVQLPVTFVIEALGTPVASNGAAWSATVYGGTNWVLVSANAGAGRLDPGESVTFSVQAMATQAGAFDWDNHVHVRRDCTGTELYGPLWPMAITPVAPTPSPQPSVAATPNPTPKPTSPPTATPRPDPAPTPTDTPRPEVTPSPTPSPEPTVRPTSTPPVAGGSGGSPPSGGDPVGRMAPLGDSESASIGMGMEVFGLLQGPLVWFVPGAAVGVPGLFVLLWIALQAAGALAWVPAMRRFGGDSADSRRRRRPARSG